MVQLILKEDSGVFVNKVSKDTPIFVVDKNSRVKLGMIVYLSIWKIPKWTVCGSHGFALSVLNNCEGGNKDRVFETRFELCRTLQENYDFELGDGTKVICTISERITNTCVVLDTVKETVLLDSPMIVMDSENKFVGVIHYRDPDMFSEGGWSAGNGLSRAIESTERGSNAIFNYSECGQKRNLIHKLIDDGFFVLAPDSIVPSLEGNCTDLKNYGGIVEGTRIPYEKI